MGSRVVLALARSCVVLGAASVFASLAYRALPAGALLACMVPVCAWALLAVDGLARWRFPARPAPPVEAAPANPHILHADGTRTPLVLSEDPEPCTAGHRCFLVTGPGGAPIEPGEGDLFGYDRPADFHLTWLMPEGAVDDC